MEALNATVVRKDWSSVLDCVIREKPVFIKRTRDHVFLSGTQTMSMLLSAYHFTADKTTGGAVTLTLREPLFSESAATEEEALKKLAKTMFEYAEEYYKNFAVCAASPGLKSHVPYVIKALLAGSAEELAAMIERK